MTIWPLSRSSKNLQVFIRPSLYCFFQSPDLQSNCSSLSLPHSKVRYCLIPPGTGNHKRSNCSLSSRNPFLQSVQNSLPLALHSIFSPIPPLLITKLAEKHKERRICDQPSSSLLQLETTLNLFRHDHYFLLISLFLSFFYLTQTQQTFCIADSSLSSQCFTRFKSLGLSYLFRQLLQIWRVLMRVSCVYKLKFYKHLIPFFKLQTEIIKNQQTKFINQSIIQNKQSYKIKFKINQVNQLKLQPLNNETINKNMLQSRAKKKEYYIEFLKIQHLETQIVQNLILNLIKNQKFQFLKFIQKHPFKIKSFKQEMQLTLLQLDFTVSLNACHDQVMHKMQVLTNMQIQLLRKFQHQLSNSQMHLQMIHDVRVMIVNLQQIYKDVKLYFDEMGIKFIYDFFRKIQVLMVCGYNFLSQALLVNFDRIQDKKNKQSVSMGNVANCKECKCRCSDSAKDKKRQIKQVQQFDFKISFLQNQEQKLALQIQNIYDKMMMQKAIIQKTKPSLAIRELQDMKQHIQKVIQSTNSIFQESYMMKYVQFKNYLAQIKKPQDIVDYFISNMTFNMKEKFLHAMQKAIYKAQNTQQRLSIKHSRDVEVQTQKPNQTFINYTGTQSTYRAYSSLKPEKNQSLLTKQRKKNQSMMAQIQFIRKQLNSFTAQNQDFKKQIFRKQAQRAQYQLNYETLEQLYSKRRFQIQDIQSQNRWLITQKQSQTKKLRGQIKQLRKEQIKTIDQETQTYITPNCVNSSTETQIIYFQNQIDNQVINVLKKNNQKIILNLNQKERKIRQLNVIREQTQNLRECKIFCMGFLEDLRQVTKYKMIQITKQKKQTNKSTKSRQSNSRKPIIPLNQHTSNQSVMLTIEKLNQEIKTLLFTTNSSKTGIVQKRRSSGNKNKTTFTNMEQSHSKIYESSDLQGNSQQRFFRNAKHRKDTFFSSEKQKKKQTNDSHYKLQHIEKSKKDTSGSQSSADQKELESSQRSDSHTKIQRTISAFEGKIKPTLGRKQSLNDFRSKTTLFQNNKIFQEIFQQNNTSQKIQGSVDAGILRKINIQSHINSNGLTGYGQYSQQTELSSQYISQLEQTYLNVLEQKRQLCEQNGQLIEQRKQLRQKPQYQSFFNRKHPYVIKPGMTGRFTTDMSRGNESQRNLSINHTLPMNQNEVSQTFLQQINKNKDQFSYHNVDSFNRNDIARTSNITPEPRLSTLGVSKNQNKVNSSSGPIVFRKANQNYEKSSSQLVFDQLKLDKHLDSQEQKRNVSYKNDSLMINSQSSRKVEPGQIISKIQCQNQKQNFSRNQKYMKSLLVQKIIEQDQNNSRATSNNTKLIQVRKKTPLQRQRYSPAWQHPETVFTRTVKQMFLSSLSKQNLMQKIKDIYLSLEKQKQNKKIKKIINTQYTSRNLNQRKHQKTNQANQILKLAQIIL